jgi:hypothetical protein
MDPQSSSDVMLSSSFETETTELANWMIATYFLLFFVTVAAAVWDSIQYERREDDFGV